MDLNNQSYLYHEDPAYGVSSTSPLSQVKIIKEEFSTTAETLNTQVPLYMNWVASEMAVISQFFEELSIEAKEIPALSILKKAEKFLPKIKQYIKDEKYKIKHDTTTYLLSSPANAKQLLESIKDVENGNLIEKDLDDL